ncbi:MAG: VirB4 family type IV secretion system protein [Candidatus Dormibacteria bacterium]
MILARPPAPRGSTLQLVDVEFLENQVAHLSNGAQRAALQIEPVNLALQGEVEQEQVWRRYRQLLAALTGPVSIYSSSKPEPGGEEWHPSAAGDGPIQLLARQDLEFCQQLIRGHLVQKQRHLVVVWGGELANPLAGLSSRLDRLRTRAKSHTRVLGGGIQVGLDQRCEVIAASLGQLGARARRIGDGEWLQLLQEHGSGRSDREPVSFASWVAPDDAEVLARQVRVGDRWSRTLFVASYPRRVAIGWLAPLLRGLECEVTVAQHLVPLPKLLSLSRLRRKIRGFETSLVVDHLRGQRPDRGTETALGDALTLEEQVLVEEERLFQLELFVTLAAETVAILDSGWQQLLTTMAELGCGAVPLTHRHIDGWRATIPTGVSPFGWGREMTASALATGFPFLRSNLAADTGVLLGPSLISRELVIVDPFAHTNPNFNIVVLGTSGGGKSYTAKLLAARLALRGCRLRCIDPVGEYRELGRLLDGACRDIAPGRSSGLSALGPAGVEGDGAAAASVRAARALVVLELLAAGRSGEWDLPEDDAEALEATLTQLFSAQQDPQLPDLVAALEEAGRSVLARRLGRFTGGLLGGIFDGRAGAELAGLATVFSLAGWGGDREQLLAPAMQMILLQLESETSRDQSALRLVVVDEAEVLLGRPRSAAALEALSRRVRKLGTGLMVISQVVEDFLNSPVGNVIVRNCHTKLLLRQEEVAIPAVRAAFGLSPAECDLLRDAPPGCGIVIAGRERAAFQGAAPPALHQVLCTDAEALG